jgi:hypothetical protein
MPPWMPDPSCRSFEHQRGLSADERAIFGRWMAGGMLEGSIDDLPPAPPQPPRFEATHVARMTEPYTPDPARPDDYRCFLLDFEIERDLFLSGRNVVPGAASLVHHVLAYGVSEELVAQVEAADAADPGPGYTCFGGPLSGEGGSGGADASAIALIGLGGWVPGQLPFLEAPGRAVYLPARSRIVIQVHYNLLEHDPAPDETEYQMMLTETPPEYVVSTAPLAILDLDIRAGDPDARYSRVFRNYRSDAMHVTGMTPHMHLLGKQLRAEVVPGAGSERACLVDIPRWDFNWQQSYGLRSDDAVVLETGDGIELTCVYDNSPSNQPIINGEQVEPRNVTWGEGTLDEMCLMYIQHESPWTGPPPTGCEAAAECLASCETNDASCLLACEGLGGGCRTCLLQGTLGCARDTCLTAYAGAATCIQSCILSYVLLGGSFERCMETECSRAYPAVAECIAGVVDAGTCDARLAECGIVR